MTTPRPPEPGPFAKGTLGRQLVVRVAILVAAVTLLLAAATTLIVRQILMDGVDGQLNASVGITDAPDRPHPQPRGVAAESIEMTGIVVDLGDGQTQLRITDNALLKAGTATALTPGQQLVIARIPADGQHHSVAVPGLGEYRFVHVSAGAAQRWVGIPTADLERALRNLTAIEAALALLALFGSVLIARVVVRSALRPLNRLAQTATEVSELQLDRGEVELATRVPDSDAQLASEVGRVGVAFNRMLDNVEDALAARQRSETRVRQFVADASHELRNPLAAIRGYAELTNRDAASLPPGTAFALERIGAESRRMSSLVEDMLLLARLDNGRSTDFVPVDVVEVVLNATSDARAAGPQHQWTLDVPDTPVLISADANQLHQVITNLASNARKHTPPGTRVEIRVTTAGPSGPGGQAVITVTDNGPGIDPQILDHVFERFARADSARAHGAEASTGLGLAIVAAVVHAHGGVAGVESVPGRTCFTVRLPLIDQGCAAPSDQE